MNYISSSYLLGECFWCLRFGSQYLTMPEMEREGTRYIYRWKFAICLPKCRGFVLQNPQKTGKGLSWECTQAEMLSWLRNTKSKRIIRFLILRLAIPLCLRKTHTWMPSLSHALMNWNVKFCEWVGWWNYKAEITCIFPSRVFGNCHS